MNLTFEEREMLEGKSGKATQKAMEILTALGTIYGAERMVPVNSVQISGVSYDNLGEAGLQWLDEMANGGGRTNVLTTLNPTGMDIENWQALGIDPDFARNQERVISAFARMDVLTTCTCTPYLIGNLPHYGEHIAWAESSAVCYANSVLGARTNREGGPSALAAALAARTPNYGYHLDAFRHPTLTFNVKAELHGSSEFGCLGMVIGRKMETLLKKPVPFIRGVKTANLEELKSFCASLATYGGAALFHMEGITPESAQYAPPTEIMVVTQDEIEDAFQAMTSAVSGDVDFVSLGCPHLSIQEIAHLADLLKGKKVTKEFWITTARPTRSLADQMGYSQIIKESGAKFAVDTCCVVAPIKGRFKALATDSAKAAYYACNKHQFAVLYRSFDEVVDEALK